MNISILENGTYVSSKEKTFRRKGIERNVSYLGDCQHEAQATGDIMSRYPVNMAGLALAQFGRCSQRQSGALVLKLPETWKHLPS